MLEKYLDFDSYSDQYTVDDWNILIKDVFYRYFPNDVSFLKNKDILRTELINYIPLSQNLKYLRLFENTILYFQDLKKQSYSDFEDIFLNHYEKLIETDTKWTRFCLSQQEIGKLSRHDVIAVKFKALEEILEGCFKERFKLLFHTECFFENNCYQENLDFGQYITKFKNPINQFYIYLADPCLNIKTSQWRNIAAHNTYKIRKEHIEITYGKNNPKIVNLSYSQFENVFQWVKNIYSSLRLAEVLTIIGNPTLIQKISNNNYDIPLRIEQWLLQLVHNLQIVGFPFVKILEEQNSLSIILKKKKSGDLKDSVIHASQCLDQFAFGIYSDEFSCDKYKYAKVIIVSEILEELGSAYVEINDICNNEKDRDLIDCVKFKLGDIVF